MGGDILTASEPSGDFVLEHDGIGPIVLVSAGVGYTPILSMLYGLIDADTQGKYHGASIYYIHGARDGANHSGFSEVKDLSKRAETSQKQLRVHTAYSRPLPDDNVHDSVGRVDAELIARLVGADLPTANVYCCGPAAFMASLQESLGAHGLDSSQYHYERF